MRPIATGSVPAAWLLRSASLFLVVALPLVASDAFCETPTQQADLQGRYVFAGSIASTLEISRDGDRYVVVLTGGSPQGAGAAAPADCSVRAVGTLENDVLDAAFTSVDTDTFTYSQNRAAKEGRRLRIVVHSSGAEVTRADTDGYCGLGATFVGRYRRAQ